MQILQGAVHIFSNQPNRVIKQLEQELKRKRHYNLKIENPPKLTIIQYSHAVSFFCPLDLSYEYIAEVYSRKMKAIVLVSVVGVRDGPFFKEQQAFKMFWGVDGKCVMQSEIISNGDTVICKPTDVQDLKKHAKSFILDNSVLYKTCFENKLPLEVVQALEKELHIFIGGVELQEVVKFCSVNKQEENISYFFSR